MKMMQHQKYLKKGLAGLLALAMLAGMVVPYGNVITAKAEEGTAVAGSTTEPAAMTVNLKAADGSIPGITNPTPPTNTKDEWTGSRVYFGSYKDNPLLFRVLDARTTDYSADGTTKTMFLDCDTTLERVQFDPNNASNVWSNSYLKAWMNSKDINNGITNSDGTTTDFTDSDGIVIPGMLSGFTQMERSAIALSSRDSITVDGWSYWMDLILSWCSLSNDRVFALDAREASNSKYGYSTTFEEVANKQKTGSGEAYWLRSPCKDITADVGLVYSNGDVGDNYVNSDVGVSPALNLNLTSVLFTSACGENGAGSVDKSSSFAKTEVSSSNTWNLTLLGGSGFAATLGRDEAAPQGTVTVNVKNLGVQADGSTAADGSYYSQLSAMLVDENGTVAAYGKIADSAAKGEVSFTLPEGIAIGDYTLKVFAEKVNSSATGNVTDYASNMASFDFAVQTPRTVKNINLNINGRIPGITDPTPPTNTTDAWTGSRVYFGSYKGSPLLFRVLDARTTDYSADGTTKTMLLDCDTTLEKVKFDPNGASKVWNNSYLKAWMNSKDINNGITNSDGTTTDFTDSDGIVISGMLSGFTQMERSAIALSSRDSITVDGLSYWIDNSFRWCSLSNDRVFALDAMEASNPEYGYSTTSVEAANKQKTGSGGDYWWLRSPCDASNYDYAGFVIEDGSVAFSSVDYKYSGVSPALNLNLSSVLFTSANGENGAGSVDKSSSPAEVGTDKISANIWKLTLLDGAKTVKVTDGRSAYKETVGGTTTITVPYTYTGVDVSQISVMITNTDRTERDAEVLYYGSLNTALDDTAKVGVGTFTLPSGLPEGYRIYLLAEDVNGDNYSDFVSEPLELKQADIRHKGTLTLPDISKIYDGSAVADITTVSGYTTNNTTGTVTVEYTKQGENAYSATVPTEAGRYTVRVSIAQSDTHTAVSATKDFTISYLTVPENPYTITPVSPNEAGWYKEAVTITPAVGYTVSTQLNGTYTATLTVSASVKAYRIYLKNAQGQMTDAIIVGDMNIDTAAPTGFTVKAMEVIGTDSEGDVSQKDYTSGVWTDNAVTFTASGAAAISGILKYQYSTDGGNTWQDMTAVEKTEATETEPFNVTKAELTISSDCNGVSYIFRAVSNAGYESANSSATVVKIDRTIPTISVNGTTDKHKTEDTVSITPTAGISGMARVEVRKSESTDWTDITAVYTAGYKVTENNTYTFRVTNGAGVTAEDSITYTKIDMAKPVVNLDSNGYTDGAWTTTDVTLEITNATSNLGTGKYEYSTDGGTTWLAYPTAGIVINTDTDGTTYSFRITSAAGAASDVKAITVKRDTQVPVIKEIVDGAVYYTTQSFTVDDENFASVTINGVEMNVRTINLTLAGNVEETYVVKATDLAGQESVCTVTMKLIASIDDSIEELTTDNVTSADRSDVEQVQKTVRAVDTTDATAEEKAELEAISGKCQKLLEKIAEVEAAKAPESVNRVEDIKPDNVKPEDKKDLEEALEDLKEILEDNRDNLTEEEKKELQDRIDEMEAAIRVIVKVEDTQAEIDALPKAEDVKASDREAVEAAKKAYEELTEYEKSLVDRKKLDAAAEALAKLGSGDDMPATGDASELWVWFALVFASGAGIFVANRRRRQIRG